MAQTQNKLNYFPGYHAKANTLKISKMIFNRSRGKVINGNIVTLRGNIVISQSEFKKNVLEVMRQPLEDGRVTISRALTSITYPSRFMLVTAMNPCPCGYLGDPQHSCSCTPVMIQRYRSRISGPLLDRIDLHIEVPAVKYRDLADRADGEPSASIASRVESCRNLQIERFKGTKIHCNAQMPPRFIKKFCEPDAGGHRLLEIVTDRLGLSARSYTRILKVARTIADLEASENIREQHLAEAIQYRSLDRKTG